MHYGSIHTHYPTRFKGVFSQRKDRYEPFIATARQTLASAPIPAVLQPWYHSMVTANPQPSFILLPLIFLAVADESGGITSAHEEYLPVLMLAMEACALMDDTVDRTRMRSDRPTFPETFGDVSSVPMLAALLGVIFQETQRIDSRILGDLAQLFTLLGSLELWEYHHRYPSDSQTLALWLDHRYAQVTPAVTYAFNAALLLNQQPPIPPHVAQSFAEIFQDVDDIVNIQEQRQLVGEHDDLKMGMVTHPLLVSMAAPAVRSGLIDLWAVYRSLQFLPRHELTSQVRRMDALAPLQATYQSVHSIIEQIGIPATLEKIHQDAASCVEAVPAELKQLMGELVAAFIDRIAHSEILYAQVGGR
ncbi:MAG: polyprenyl synthetase family protein [Herpetosiphonaceae bacterium]|nr:polyprenyl synthetase family protein [Herpetosiphonaceae bacterium]